MASTDRRMSEVEKKIKINIFFLRFKYAIDSIV